MLITWLINSYLAFCFLLFAMTTLLQLGVCPLWLRKAETTFKLFYLIYCTHAQWWQWCFLQTNFGSPIKIWDSYIFEKKNFQRSRNWLGRKSPYMETPLMNLFQPNWTSLTPYKRLDLLCLFTFWKEKISHVRKCFAWCLLALLFCITWIP